MRKGAPRQAKCVVGEYPSRNSPANIYGPDLSVGTKELVEGYNTYLITSITEIRNSIEHIEEEEELRIDSKIDQRECELTQFKMVTESELGKILIKMKNKSDTDGNISSITMKLAFKCIGDYLIRIYNNLLMQGLCPDEWKVSTIVPIPKVKIVNKYEDLRPINMLPEYEKILERVVKQQVVWYLENNSIITDCQYGFREQKSCELAIQNAVCSWKQDISIGKKIGVIFIDLKRAFETIDRVRLVQKMEKYGIKGTVKTWFERYLSNRRQKVKCGKHMSEEIGVECGVPQGSVLGPLLFLIYINDILQVRLDGCHMKLFADDLIVYSSSDSVGNIKTILKKQMRLVEKWLNVNKLKLNIKKTKFLLLHGKRNTAHLKNETSVQNVESMIEVSGVPIEEVNEMKYLGVVLDRTMSLKEHVNYIVKKVGKKIGYLKRVGKYLTAYTRATVYRTIVSPHYEYCCTLLLNVSATDQAKLQRTQNRAMRIILECSRFTSVKEMLDSLCFLSIKERVYYNVCVLIHKIKEGKLCNGLYARVVNVCDVHTYGTRQQGCVYIASRRTREGQKDLMYDGLKAYNGLPQYVKGETNLKSFKREVANYVKEKV